MWPRRHPLGPFVGFFILTSVPYETHQQITGPILAQNAGRDFERLTTKLELLRQDPFAFFRGANPLLLDFRPRAHPLILAPSMRVCGDLHLENFGAFKGDGRLAVPTNLDISNRCRESAQVQMEAGARGVLKREPGGR